ncbi:hypothetical protein BTM_1128 [Burkholderia thailandensis 34]|uniref:DUF2523 family protein n=1 Tax=Burkholderia thailandensis TaxID=57975 RepID=UPI0005D8B6C2|nr:DUF2523 family protein [Burkholderia thailandensis]AJY30412.1 hypothetical protein BTM_1128 [Burkholderia thailandensis 34]
MTWATWLLSLVQPIIVQALVALGVGVVTVAGIDLALNQAMQWLRDGFIKAAESAAKCSSRSWSNRV